MEQAGAPPWAVELRALQQMALGSEKAFGPEMAVEMGAPLGRKASPIGGALLMQVASTPRGRSLVSAPTHPQLPQTEPGALGPRS